MEMIFPIAIEEANIDNQKWIAEFFYEALHRDGYLVSVAPDAERAMEYIKTDRFDLVLLSLYLNYGYNSWDVLQGIKALPLYLPVIMLAAYDNYLYDPQLDLANGYVVRGWSAVEELIQQVDAILGDNFEVSTTPLKEEHQMADAHPCQPDS